MKRLMKIGCFVILILIFLILDSSIWAEEPCQHTWTIQWISYGYNSTHHWEISHRVCSKCGEKQDVKGTSSPHTVISSNIISSSESSCKEEINYCNTSYCRSEE